MRRPARYTGQRGAHRAAGVEPPRTVCVPEARLVAGAERGTHAVLDAAIGPCRTPKRELAHDL
ncbi:hypothetical protein [Rhodococcus erythropolis]|uniref:hypothetical protein n=1 Tax=Rhodococcus erythropolis TaxID=1833 RepID=UPI0024B85268|nr:hypothetical protein [Rhodococcus erythropolis]MDJ0015493.1 hypothetical protein [Rhodococcus erythropolis]